MDVLIFGGVLITLSVIGWLMVEIGTSYVNKKHNKFMEAFRLKFNNSIIDKLKQLYTTKEILDEYYDTHVKYTTYETIELYRRYKKDNIHQKLREQYYEIIGLEDHLLLQEFDVELFDEQLKQAEFDLNALKDSVVNQIESRFMRGSK